MFEKIEKTRKKTLILVTVVWIIGIICSIYFLVGGLGMNKSDAKYMRTLSLVPLLIAATIHKSRSDKYAELFRLNFFKEIVGNNDYQISFENSVGFGSAEIKNWGIVPNVNYAVCKDAIRGSKGQNAFLLCQMDVVGRDRLEGAPLWFSGIYLIFKLKESSKGTILLRTNDNLREEKKQSQFGFLDVKLNAYITGKHKFDEEIHVYAENERLVQTLTESRMENLLKLYKHFGYRLWMGIVDDELHVAINATSGFFLPGLMRPVTGMLLEKQKKSMNDLKQLIDMAAKID